MTNVRYVITICVLTGLVACTTTPEPTALPIPIVTATPAAAPTTTNPPPSPSGAPSGDPQALLSQETLFGYMEDLAAIQPHSGWRNSATEGEAEALDYVAEQLALFPYLQSLGLELERQSFHVFMTTELWDTGLELVVDGQAVQVPADGMRGPRDDTVQALRFDSDGVLNDTQRDPVTVEGDVLLVNSSIEIAELTPDQVRGKIVFLNDAVINRVLTGGTQQSVMIAMSLLQNGPAGLVLVTQFSSLPGDSHGYGVGDISPLNWVETQPSIPTLFVRLEDLEPAGITTWDDLMQVESARLTWDADVLLPGTSGNLAARIPGADSTSAVILGAHIDSPNCPGAMDDGSGSAALLEIARVLDAAQVQPPVDLYLVWFGSEEIGLYGGAYFANTHQELLDRTLAMLQFDDLTRPLDGIEAEITLVGWSYAAFGDGRLTWPDYLSQAAEAYGIQTVTMDVPEAYSDNSTFGGFGVPNADVIYENDAAMQAIGGFHYAALVHSPYDTIEVAREMGDVLEQMTRVTLIAALEAGRDLSSLRTTPPADRRALIVASHTEPAQMTPAALTEFGMTLAWEGFDVDLVPYGQPVTAADLEDADLVIVLPVSDYPSPEVDTMLYDEAWSEEEVGVLEAYVDQGGLLVLTNSAHRLKYWIQDLNEDQRDVNMLAERFGVAFLDGRLPSESARVNTPHDLVEGMSSVMMIADNSVPFTLAEGQVLAQAGEEPIIAVIDHGNASGQVIVLADLGILVIDTEANATFWRNLARYARAGSAQ